MCVISADALINRHGKHKEILRPAGHMQSTQPAGKKEVPWSTYYFCLLCELLACDLIRHSYHLHTPCQLQQLLEMRDNERGYTPLLDAVAADAPGNLQLLIDHGAEVEVVATKSPDRLTPMHIAAEKGSAECLKLLLGAGTVYCLSLIPKVELFVAFSMRSEVPQSPLMVIFSVGKCVTPYKKKSSTTLVYLLLLHHPFTISSQCSSSVLVPDRCMISVLGSGAKNVYLPLPIMILLVPDTRLSLVFHAV